MSKKEQYNILEDEQNEEVRFAFDQFIKMRVSIRKKPTEYAITLLMMKLTALSSGEPDKAIEILNQSIVNNWQDLYALRENTPGSVESHITANQKAKNL